MDELIEGLVKLNDKIIDLRKRIQSECNVDYTSQDARHVALDSIQQMLFSLVSILISIDKLCIKDMEDISTKFQTEPVRGSSILIEKMDHYLRTSLITLCHFQIDNLFFNLLRNNDPNQYEKESFAKKCDKIFEISNLPKNGDEYKILMTLTHLRNSLHNNGIHRGSDFESTIDGLKYPFKKGEKAKCASWKHIMQVLNANITMVEKILFSEDFKINTKIKDDFSSNNP
ncbi:MAG: hypothetical protein KAU14_06350 [Thermoplasmata archaeon]|nr:hypothetical protein [Thermoplasmata archaeon]